MAAQIRRVVSVSSSESQAPSPCLEVPTALPRSPPWHRGTVAADCYKVPMAADGKFDELSHEVVEDDHLVPRDNDVQEFIDLVARSADR